MKKTAFVLGISILSSLCTLLLYKAFFEQKQVQPKVVNNTDQPYVVKTNFNTIAQTNTNNRSASPTNFTESAKLAAPAVVHIRALYSAPGGRIFDELWGRDGNAEISSGSGVVISSDGFIVTNNHVIEDGDRFEVTFSDKKSLEAKVIGKDPSTDLALIKVEGNGFPHLQLANSDSVQVGEWVLAVGNPFNLTSTVTAGIVSAKGRNIDILTGDYSIESFIQTDAAVNPGNSGGALVNTKGDLIGINTAIITRSGRYEGYSFAVPSNLVNKVISDLSEFGAVQRGFLGVNIADIDQELSERLKLSSMDGVYISRVNPGSAAIEAGLKAGDIITHINGNSVKSTPELQEQVAQYRPGQSIEVSYLRDGNPKKGNVVLKNKNNSTELISKNQSILLKQLGFDLRNLHSNEQRQLGKNGVYVLSIMRGSKIDRTNMEPGFIITKINDVAVTKVENLIKILEKTEGKVVLEGIYQNYDGDYFYAFAK